MCMRKCANENMVHHVYMYSVHIQTHVRYIRHKLIGHPMSLQWYICLSVRIRGVCVCIRFPSIPIIFKLPSTIYATRVFRSILQLYALLAHTHTCICARARAFIHISIDVEYCTYTRTHTAYFCYGKLTCANKYACLNARRFLMVELCWIAARVEAIEVKPLLFGSKVRKQCKQRTPRILYSTRP